MFVLGNSWFNIPFLYLASVLIALSPTVYADEVFHDLEMEGGFQLSARNTQSRPLEVGVVLRAAPALQPAWRLAQWGTRYDLSDAKERELPGGTRSLGNIAKKVTLHPGGLVGEGITLSVDGTTEYGGRLRQQGEPWPHLLVEQRVPKDFWLGPLSSLTFRLSFKIDYCDPEVGAALNPSLHTAQVSAYWTLHNENPKNEDYQDMIWFGLPLFDARYDVPPGHQALDAGQPFSSGKFICNIEGSRFFKGRTGDGQWYEIACDLIPLVKEALEAARKAGIFTHTQIEDLQVTSFNIGWEVPGPYDCAITLKGMSLDKTLR